MTDNFWRSYGNGLEGFAAFVLLFFLWQGLRGRLRRKLFYGPGKKDDMGFFAKLKADAEAVERKIAALVAKYGPRVEEEVKAETLAIVKRLVAYMEEKLPEAEKLVKELADRVAPGLGTAAQVAEAVVVPKVEGEVNQKIDPEDPHAP